MPTQHAVVVRLPERALRADEIPTCSTAGANSWAQGRAESKLAPLGEAQATDVLLEASLVADPDELLLHCRCPRRRGEQNQQHADAGSSRHLAVEQSRHGRFRSVVLMNLQISYVQKRYYIKLATNLSAN